MNLAALAMRADPEPPGSGPRKRSVFQRFLRRRFYHLMADEARESAITEVAETKERCFALRAGLSTNDLVTSSAEDHHASGNQSDSVRLVHDLTLQSKPTAPTVGPIRNDQVLFTLCVLIRQVPLCRSLLNLVLRSLDI
jgi:hypothetical protein